MASLPKGSRYTQVPLVPPQGYFPLRWQGAYKEK